MLVFCFTEEGAGEGKQGVMSRLPNSHSTVKNQIRRQETTSKKFTQEEGNVISIDWTHLGSPYRQLYYYSMFNNNPQLGLVMY